MNKEHIPYQSNEQAFSIRRIRQNFNAQSINEIPHRHEFNEFLYIKSGTGKHEVDGIPYNLTANTLYIISKGQVHEFLYAKDLEGTLIRFQDSILPAVNSPNEGFYYNLLFSLRGHTELNIQLEDQALIELLLARMQQEFDNQTSSILDLSLIQHLLYPLIILMNRYAAVELNVQDYRQDQYSQFLENLEQSFKQEHGLQFYAQNLGISSRKLTEICQVNSGKTGKKIINDRVITESKRLMKYTALPLKDIANQLGFKDLGYFCRHFKKATGYTPSEYKQS